MPQRPSLLQGTPREFLATVSSFGSRKRSEDNAFFIHPEYPFEVAKSWGISEELWDRAWANLSGGESQRIAMAVAVGMQSAEVLLLDGEALACFLMDFIMV